MTKHYIMADLVNVKDAYESNMRLLKDNVDGPDHMKYVHIERRLFSKEVRIRKALGLLAQDPCPLPGAKGCDECTGYYYTKYKPGTKSDIKKCNAMCENTQPNAIVCPYKSGRSELAKFLARGGEIDNGRI